MSDFGSFFFFTMAEEAAPGNIRKLTDGAGAGQLFPSELALFQEPPLLAAFSSEEIVDYRPTSASLDMGSIDYTIPPSATQMLDLRSSRHHLKLRIVHADGSLINVGDEDPVAPINYIGATIFETVQLFINQTLVTPSGGQHTPYRSIIEVLLDRSHFEKSTILESGLYQKDEAYKMHDAGSTSFQWRFAHMTGSQPCDVIGNLPVDLAAQERLLLNGVEVSLKFYPARPEFTLISHAERPDYRIQIMDAFLRVKKKTLLPSLLLAVENTMSISPCLYPINRTECADFYCREVSTDSRWKTYSRRRFLPSWCSVLSKNGESLVSMTSTPCASSTLF